MTKKVLVIGASSQIAKWADQMLAAEDNIDLTLFLRHPNNLPQELQAQNVIVGDAINLDDVRLGKTLSTLVSLVQLLRKLRQLSKRWISKMSNV